MTPNGRIIVMQCKKSKNDENNNVIILIFINEPAGKLATLCGRGDRSLARGACRGGLSSAPHQTAHPPTERRLECGTRRAPHPVPRPVRTPITTTHRTVLARSHFEAISHLYGNSSAARCWYRLLLRANQQPCASTAPPSKLVVVTEACVSAFGRFSNARLAYCCCVPAVHIIILLFRVRRAVCSRIFPAAPKNSKIQLFYSYILNCPIFSTSKLYKMVSTRQQSSSSSSGSSTKVVVIPKPEKNFSVVNLGQSSSSHINLLDLPYEILEKILSYTNFKHISQLRSISRHFNVVCSTMLNSTFQRLQNQMLNRFQIIKTKMPRRESARRQHPLACESDIVETLHMRLLLLRMAFGKHIERKHICFFAGEILDEVYKILHYIKVTSKLARPYKVTDELFDLSTMAMEYFREKIEPTLPEIRLFANDYHEFPSPLGPPNTRTITSMCLRKRSLMIREGSVSSLEGKRASSESPQCGTMLRKSVGKIKQGIKTSQSCHLERDFLDLRKQLRKTSTQSGNAQRELKQCKSQMAEQHKTLVEYSSRMDEYDKKNEETNRKFSTLLQELNKCKTEIQYLQSASSSSTLSVCSSCSTTASDLSLVMGPPVLNSTTNTVRTRLHSQGDQIPENTNEDSVEPSEPVVFEEVKSSDEQEPSTSTGVKRKLELAIPKAAKRVRAVAKKVRSINNAN